MIELLISAYVDDNNHYFVRTFDDDVYPFISPTIKEGATLDSAGGGSIV